MTDNIVQFPNMHQKTTPDEALEAAKGWDFEEVVIIGFEKNSETVIYSYTTETDKRSWLEMSELLKVMFLKMKGWL